MRMMIWIMALLVVLPFGAEAQMVFRRELMVIVPKAELPVVLTEDTPDAPKPNEAKPDEEAAPPAPAEFTVEVMGERAMRLEAITSLARLSDDTGVMILFEDPIELPQMRMNIYTPVDVLMVNAEGTITQIMPELILGNLAQEIPSSRPILAFLYLKAGVCAANGIKPGARVEHPYFTPKPTVLEE